MTQSDQAAFQRRWIIIVLGVTLALCLLALTILDYAIGAHNTAAIAAAVLLLGLLSVLLIRICLRERDKLSLVLVPTDEGAGTTAFLILLALIILATALRLYQLGQESFWYDEAWTALWASRSASDLLRMVNPLPHLVAHLSLLLGRSEFILRLGPALAGILLIPATYLLGRVLYRRREGLIAAGILTVSVYAIYHSQELRFYSWQMLFSTLTLYFLLHGLQRQRWLDWAGFAVTTAFNLYSHPATLFVLASEGLYVLGILIPEVLRSRTVRPVDGHRPFSSVVRRLAPPAIAALVALVAFGPGWGHLASLSSNPNWAVSPELASADTQGGVWFSAPIATWTYEVPSLLLALKHPLLLGAAFALFFIGLLSSPRQQRALILLWFLVPPVVLFVVRLRFYDRYLSYFLPLLTIVMAHGIDHLASAIGPIRRRRMVALALLTVLTAAPNLAQLPGYYQSTQKEQWRELVSWVESSRQPGDLVLVTLNSGVWAPQEPFDWYRTVPDPELPWQFFPEGGVLTDRAQLAELPTVVQGHPRVWFVLPSGATQTEQEISEALEEWFRLVQEREFVQLRAILYGAVSQ